MIIDLILIAVVIDDWIVGEVEGIVKRTVVERSFFGCVEYWAFRI